MTSSPKLTNWDNPKLKTPSMPVEFINGRITPALEEELNEKLLKDWVSHKIYCVSGPLVGIYQRVILLVAETPILLINPMLVDQSENLVTLEEFAANMPVGTIKITRPDSIRVRYSDVNGNKTTQVFHGVSCRLVQQQMDYLDGITPLDRAGYVRRESILKALKKYERVTTKLRKLNE
jgi:peptide deformylase